MTLKVVEMSGPDFEELTIAVRLDLSAVLVKIHPKLGWGMGLALISHVLGEVAVASAGSFPREDMPEVVKALQANLANGAESFGLENIKPSSRA